MAEGDYLFTLYKASLSSKRIAYKKYLCDVFYNYIFFDSKTSVNNFV